MKYITKELHGIPNMMKLGKRQRVRSQVQHEHEILSELAQLSREKTWLNKEKDNWQERINRINKRLLDIEELEKSLIPKQTVIKEQSPIDVKRGNQTSAKESHEIIVKY